MEEMPKKRTLFEKITRAVLGVVIVALIGVALFLLLFVVFGIYLWIQGGFRESAYFFVSGLFFLLFLGLSVIISKIENRFHIFGPKRKLTKADLKQVGYAIGAIIGEYIFVSAVDFYLKLFPKTISTALAMEILRTIIQTNGFLIGFSGIVFAQMFWAIHNQQSGIQMKIIENPVPQTSPQETPYDVRRDYLTVLERKRTSMIISMFIVMNAFVISILLSLSGMSQIETLETIPTNPYITNPFWSMSIAIIIFVVFIAQSKMSLSEEDVKKVREKSEKSKKK
jgi:hypothetical protein